MDAPAVPTACRPCVQQRQTFSTMRSSFGNSSRISCSVGDTAVSISQHVERTKSAGKEGEMKQASESASARVNEQWDRKNRLR